MRSLEGLPSKTIVDFNLAVELNATHETAHRHPAPPHQSAALAALLSERPAPMEPQYQGLRVGWQVDRYETTKLRFWDTGASVEQLGVQQETDLVVLPPDKFQDTHCVIVAQSGAGKSFFLARLIEELLVRTRARCVVFDPNGDFSKVHELTTWNAETCREGRLFHTEEHADFVRDWLNPETEILHRSGSREDRDTLGVVWQRVRTELITEGLDPVMRREVQLLHDAFRAVSFLAWMNPQGGVAEQRVSFRETYAAFGSAVSEVPPKNFDPKAHDQEIRELFPQSPEQVAEAVTNRHPGIDKQGLLHYLRTRRQSALSRIENAERAAQETARRFYKSTALQLLTSA